MHVGSLAVRRPRPPRNAESLTKSALTDLEVRVLDAVCRYGPYHSPVALASDLWRGHGDDWHVANADWVEWLLYGLCDQGFVILREHPPVGPTDDPTATVYMHGLHISYARATPEAFDLLDFPPLQYAVGSRLSGHRDAMLRPGDTTEFRFHAESAVGGEVERLTVGEHLAWYPSHRHNKTGW